MSLPSLTIPVPGRITYVHASQDRRLPFGVRIRIDGHGAETPYQPEPRPPWLGLPSAWPAQATYEAAAALFVAWRDLPPDVDAVRDLVVARTARGECCSCGEATRAQRTYREYPPRRGPGWHTIRPGDFAFRRVDYPCCDRPDCTTWLDAQELLGRLPHQSSTPPRARWALEGDAWSLTTRDRWLAYVVPYGSGWGIISGPRRDSPAGPVLGIGEAMAEAELEAVGVGPGRVPSVFAREFPRPDLTGLLAEETDRSMRALEAFLERDALLGRGPFTAQYEQQPMPRPERTWPVPRRGRR